MNYSEWLEKVWQAIDTSWKQLPEDKRALGIPCDETLLAHIGIDAYALANHKTAEAVNAVYKALKDLKRFGLILELQSGSFRPLESGLRRLSRPLSPLLEPYRRRQLVHSEALFLGKLVDIATVTAQDQAKRVQYITTKQCRVADVYENLGWSWAGTANPDMLGMIYDLRDAGMIETTYITGDLQCGPTCAGMAWSEGQNAGGVGTTLQEVFLTAE